MHYVRFSVHPGVPTHNSRFCWCVCCPHGPPRKNSLTPDTRTVSALLPLFPSRYSSGKIQTYFNIRLNKTKFERFRSSAQSQTLIMWGFIRLLNCTGKHPPWGISHADSSPAGLTACRPAAPPDHNPPPGGCLCLPAHTKPQFCGHITLCTVGMGLAFHITLQLCTNSSVLTTPPNESLNTIVYLREFTSWPQNVFPALSLHSNQINYLLVSSWHWRWVGGHLLFFCSSESGTSHSSLWRMNPPTCSIQKNHIISNKC